MKRKKVVIYSPTKKKEMNILLPEFDVEIEMPQPKHYFYCITNTLNNKKYVGQTYDVKSRIHQHLSGDGSKLLLRDIVKQGTPTFKFEVLDIIYDDTRNVDEQEDTYIESFNCLYPLGYNLRLNRPIEPNDEGNTDENICIQAKFAFTNNIHKVFTVGEYTQARAYQVLTNLKNKYTTTMLRKKKKDKFNYFELRVDSDTDFNKNTIYDLKLHYNADQDCFTFCIYPAP